MTARFVAIATVAGSAALFAWQSISHIAIDGVLPWHTETMRTFRDPDLAVRATAAVAPANGIYYAPQGVLAVVHMTPGRADQSAMMGPMLGRQAMINTVAVLLVALLVMGIGAPSAREVALVVGFGALAVSAVDYLSLANWYGFPLRWALVNVVDQGIGWFLAGLAIGAVARTSAPAATA